MAGALLTGALLAEDRATLPVARSGYAGRLAVDPSRMEFRIRAYLSDWKLVEALGVPPDECARFSVRLGGDAPATGTAEFAEEPAGGVSARWTLTSAADVAFEPRNFKIQRCARESLSDGSDAPQPPESRF